VLRTKGFNSRKTSRRIRHSEGNRSKVSAQDKMIQFKEEIQFGRIQEQGKCTVQNSRQKTLKRKVEWSLLS